MSPRLSFFLFLSLLVPTILTFTFMSSASLRLLSTSSIQIHLHLPSTTLPLDSHNLVLLPSPTPPPQPSAIIVLPDNNLLLLLPPLQSPLPPLRCLFPSSFSSPVSPAGILPFSHRSLLLCPLPTPFRTRKHIPSPLLIHPQSEPVPKTAREPLPQFIRWNFLVYEATSTSADIVLFAKGVNNRQGFSRPPSDLHCAFLDHNSLVITRTAVTISAQEVFRCRHPDVDAYRHPSLKISLELNGTVLPTVALYTPRSAHVDQGPTGRSLICACTMVHNVAKFLTEWITYHSRVGVDRFILLDNGSEDGLDRIVARLRGDGLDVSTYLWPWPKTQEAGFSHAAVTHRVSCVWMMYLDVDEFVYLPSFVDSAKPDRRMLQSVLPSESEPIGQVMINCRDFGPSGLREHPVEGVTQGYTCRTRAEERHKSLVRLDAVDDSLENVVHHFKLRERYSVGRLKTHQAVVNHYKYQAWPEFRNKFKRRVSAYVVDWTRAVNAASKDRTPGLGFEAVEPENWPKRFCEVRDNGLKELTRKWFGRDEPDGSTRMAWDES